MIQSVKALLICVLFSMLYLHLQQTCSQDVEKGPEYGAHDNEDQSKGEGCIPIFNVVRIACMDPRFSFFGMTCMKMGVGKRHAKDQDKDERGKQIDYRMLKV